MTSDLLTKQSIPVIDVDDNGASIFSKSDYDLSQRGGMFLSEQLKALNFRLRRSAAAYRADWHVAGDPTLIVVLAGTVRISLRGGDYRDFTAGEMFIAKDRLLTGEAFDDSRHGHSAEVISDCALNAIHIKLDKLKG